MSKSKVVTLNLEYTDFIILIVLISKKWKFLNALKICKNYHLKFLNHWFYDIFEYNYILFNSVIYFKDTDLRIFAYFLCIENLNNDFYSISVIILVINETSL